MRVGLVAGAEAEYGVATNFSISAGVLYSMQGTKWSEGDVTETWKMDYINIPILANYYVIPGLAIKAGIQPALNVKHKVKSEADGTTTESSIDDFKNFDFSIPLGVSYEISNFVIDARYNLGVTKLWDATGSSSKNSVFQFTLGYKIPFGWFQN